MHYTIPYIILTSVNRTYYFFCFNIKNRAANSLASNGNTAQASTVPVTLSAVYFEDYLTGTKTDVTAAYTANTCVTTAYLSGDTPSAVCGFSDAPTATALLTYPAFCQVTTFFRTFLTIYGALFYTLLTLWVMFSVEPIGARINFYSLQNFFCLSYLFRA